MVALVDVKLLVFVAHKAAVRATMDYVEKTVFLLGLEKEE
jgi:hypothetical protein